MLRYGLYLGCQIPTEQYQYELSARAVLPLLGVELIDVDGFSCCGLSAKSLSVASWMYLGARNIAIMEAAGLDMLPLCNGCFNSMIEVKHILDSRPEIKLKINEHLAIEGLEYKGTNRVVHILEVLKKVDLGKLKSSLKFSLGGIRVAPHYGCHALRPSELNQVDNSEDPRILDDYLHALGATSEYYPEKLDCCGSSLIASDYEAAFKLTGAKLKALSERGYEALVTICPFCQKMFDGKQEAVKRQLGDDSPPIPTFYLTQLIGLQLGLDETSLGLNLNATPVDEFIERLNIDG